MYCGTSLFIVITCIFLFQESENPEGDGVTKSIQGKSSKILWELAKSD